MSTHKAQKLLFFLWVVLLLHVPSLAESSHKLSPDSELDAALEDVEDKDIPERLGWTSSATTGSTSTSVVFSGAGIVWLLLWGVVSFIIASAILCYWVGCEYSSTGRRLSRLLGMYVPQYIFSSASLGRPAQKQL